MPATLRNYFDLDLPSKLRLDFELVLRDADTGRDTEVAGRVAVDLDLHAVGVAFFLPSDCPLVGVVQPLTEMRELAVRGALPRQFRLSNPPPDHVGTKVRVGRTEAGLELAYEVVGGEQLSIATCAVSATIYLYVDRDLTAQEAAAIRTEGEQSGTHIRLRDRGYARRRDEIGAPRLFISHDSKDKDAIVRPLAMRLTSLGCSVWFDEFTLRPGDSLRQSIEKGLKECVLCAVVVSPRFLSNGGWAKTEYDSVFTRERVLGERVILPIWEGVSPKDVYEYSPSLADTVAIDWSKGVDQVASIVKARLDALTRQM